MKYPVKNKTENHTAILCGIAGFVAVAVGGAALVAALISGGKMAESADALFSLVIKAVATVAAITVTWLLAGEGKVTAALTGVGISVALCAVFGMLLWHLCVPDALAGIGICVGTSAMYLYLLTRKKQGGRGAIGKRKTVKLYKNFGR